MAPLMLGLMAPLRGEPERCVEAVAGLGIPSCQVGISADEPLSDELAGRLRRAAEGRVTITTIWTHCRGGQVWNFVDGPETIGLVPAATRAAGVARLKAGADFARAAGVGSITTHAGFIPENPGDPTFQAVVAALRDVCEHCLAGGLELWLETGQETPVTLLRTIEEVGADGAAPIGRVTFPARNDLGVNLDPANLLEHGFDPYDSARALQGHILHTQAKDVRTCSSSRAAQEVPLGHGDIDWVRYLGALGEVGYRGWLTVARESGVNRRSDVAEGVAFLRRLVG